jgi:hypothetical protein
VPLAALALALAAFSVLAAAGLPIITRYMLLPAALGCALCGGALAEGLRDRRWLPVSGLVLALAVVFAPSQVRRLDNLERSLGIQERILADLDALPEAALTCEPIAVTNRRPVPHLALRFRSLDPAEIEVGGPREANTYVAPSSPAVAKRFVFDPRDANRRLPRIPPSLKPVFRNDSWTIWSYTTAPGAGCRGAT